ncbi:hypothetical protein [Amantichitinum ursilacus]|uniref:Uncharacterized protein n=1 Tax=Amantichitinum ursilacus TaxID=857265 RepID=A0A0N0XL48_9NEIS|nr:hypothetical protein [Amantichitinum ursilacus]KPC53006.1 hypothetical protein WG78_10965 [Amantichitinum ursilacus]
MAQAGLHQDAVNQLLHLVDPSNTMPEGVRGVCYPVLLRGHWAAADAIAIGVLLDFKEPYSRLELSLQALDTLGAHFNTTTMEQWQFQLDVLTERVDAQALPRDEHGTLQSPFPASTIFGPARPFHYPDPGTALKRLRDMFVGFHRNIEERRQQIGGNRPNRVQAHHTFIESLRLRYGELTLIEQYEGTAIWRARNAVVSLIETACSVETVFDIAFRLAELRNETDTAAIWLNTTEGEAARKADELIQRLKHLDVTLDLAPTNPEMT